MRVWTVRRLGTSAVLGVAAALALAACEQEPTPGAANTEAPPADRAPVPLAGAPEQPPPPPPPPQRPPDALVSMQPIPNPGAPGSEGYYGGEDEAPARRLHHRYAVIGGVPVQPSPARPGPGPQERPSEPAVVAAAKPPVRRPAPLRTATPGAAPAPAAAPPPAPAPQGTQAERLAGLRTVLADALGKDAVLKAPGQFAQGTPADVSLEIPLAFGDTLLAEAKARGLESEAAAASLSATLSGAGYAVMPAEAQTVLLAGGRATKFSWTVIQHDRAAGPLRASVTASLLGGGVYPLDLGAVTSAKGAEGRGVWRVVGGVLLILLGALAAAWLARGRGGRSPSALAQRAATGGRRAPPLDMSRPPPPPENEVP